MKKKILGIMLVLMVALLLPVVASANDIGYVDFEFLFYAHPEYDVKNAELQAEISQLEQEFRGAIEKLETDEEKQALGESYELHFEQIEQGIRVELVSFVLKIIEEVAQENNISTVLMDDLIIYGGVNLTVPVVEAMYKSYGISVPSSIREHMQ